MTALATYLVTGLATGCIFALVGSGFVAIHRVTGVVNFAQGTFAVLAGLATSSLLHQGLPQGVAELVAVLVAGVAGLAVGVVAIGKRGTPPLASLVLTLGMGILAYAVELLVWGDQPKSFTMAGGAVTVAGVRVQTQYLVVIAAALATFAALSAFFNRTYLGKALTACSSNSYAARLCGISVLRMGLLAFVLGGLLGGLAGVLITPLQPVAFDSDVTLATNGFAAAIFGGLMSPRLVLLGGVLLGVAEALVGGYYTASYETEVALVLMLAFMIWQARRRSTLVEEAS